MVLKYAENIEMLFFHKFVLNMNISLIMRLTCLKIVRHVLKTHLEGSCHFRNMSNSVMCQIPIDREKIRLLFGVLFVRIPRYYPVILPFNRMGRQPLLSILNSERSV